MSYSKEWMRVKVEAARFFRPMVPTYQTRGITSWKIYNDLEFVKFDNYVSFNRQTLSELHKSDVFRRSSAS
jgi:hypothetical protein